jgi:PTH1 family peptidyl-tRNA hydrolase
MNYLIVGLGNIGPEYLFTRHNIGFMALDYLAKQKDLKFSNERLGSISLYKLKGNTIYLLKPNTFMNLSGKSVNYWMQQLKIEKENLLILVDDIALPYDTLRLKPKGSAGGHNGLKSIEATLATQEYARLRMGVGDDFPKGRQADYVLSNFSITELDNIPLILDRTSSFIENFCLEGIQKTMNKYNQ